ncbi:uncharacterized protein SNHG32 [Callithrix jacchus]
MGKCRASSQADEKTAIQSGPRAGAVINSAHPPLSFSSSFGGFVRLWCVSGRGLLSLYRLLQAQLLSDGEQGIPTACGAFAQQPACGNCKTSIAVLSLSKGIC